MKITIEEVEPLSDHLHTKVVMSYRELQYALADLYPFGKLANETNVLKNESGEPLRVGFDYDWSVSDANDPNSVAEFLFDGRAAADAFVHRLLKEGSRPEYFAAREDAFQKKRTVQQIWDDLQRAGAHFQSTFGCKLPMNDTLEEVEYYLEKFVWVTKGEDGITKANLGP